MNSQKLNRMSLTIPAMLTFALTAFGATLHVSTSGNDTNPGTSTKPFKTIQKAANMAKPGDKVIVKAGVYYEKIKIDNSGMLGRPITIQGERGPKGEWKTIIDASDKTTGWTRAPGFKYGVYRTKIPYEPYCVTSNSKDISKLGHVGDQFDGFKYLDYSPTHTMAHGNYTGTVKFWDGIEALYHYRSGYTYIRFRNQENPTQMNVRSCGTFAGVQIANQSYITIRNLHIRGAQTGVRIIGSKAGYNTVDSCHIINGQKRIAILQRAHHNRITGCKLEMGRMGKYTQGPWSYGGGYECWVHYHIYWMGKYPIGQGTSSTKDESCIQVELAGTGNEIRGNYLFDSQAGVEVFGTIGLQVSHNLFEKVWQAFIPFQGSKKVYFHSNRLFNNNFAIRMNSLNDPRGYEMYIYNNLFWTPQGKNANHFFWHVIPNSVIPATQTLPEFWVYHNTICGGGKFAMGFSDDVKTIHKLLGNSHIVNNIFSTPQLQKNMGGGIAFDYNWMGGSLGPNCDPKAILSHNIKAYGRQMWNATNLPSLKPSTEAMNRGLDLSKRFVLKGKMHNPLPGMTSAYYGNTKPDIGAIQIGGAPPPPPLPNPSRIGNTIHAAPLGSIELTVHGSTISYTLPTTGYVRLAVFDALGRMVARPIDGNRTAGTRILSLGAQNGAIANGAYYVRLNAGQNEFTQKVLVTR